MTGITFIFLIFPLWPSVSSAGGFYRAAAE